MDRDRRRKINFTYLSKNIGEYLLIKPLVCKLQIIRVKVQVQV
jgi:hypothetical protein